MWQPIETAPKKQAVLVTQNGDVAIGWCSPLVDGDYWDINPYSDDITAPTHWMPLPAPPK